MRPIRWCCFISATALLATGAWGGDEKKTNQPTLDMTKAVVCKKITGYEDFIELPDASLTSDDKLNVYFCPLNFRVEPSEKPKAGARFKAQFSEDCRIRRKGEKTVLQKKDKLLEYSGAFELRSERLYLVNNVSLKGLPPGEYELDVVLHDVLAKDATATQTVEFKIIPTPSVDATATKVEGTDKPESPPVPAVDPKKTKKTKKTKP